MWWAGVCLTGCNSGTVRDGWVVKDGVVCYFGVGAAAEEKDTSRVFSCSNPNVLVSESRHRLIGLGSSRRASGGKEWTSRRGREKQKGGRAG